MYTNTHVYLHQQLIQHVSLAFSNQYVQSPCNTSQQVRVSELLFGPCSLCSDQYVQSPCNTSHQTRQDKKEYIRVVIWTLIQSLR